MNILRCASEKNLKLENSDHFVSKCNFFQIRLYYGSSFIRMIKLPNNRKKITVLDYRDCGVYCEDLLVKSPDNQITWNFL